MTKKEQQGEAASETGKKSPPKKANPDIIRQKKEDFEITRPIEVDGKTSVLTVKCSINTKKATFKVTGEVTTVQVDRKNKKITQGTLKQINVMMGEMVDHAMEEVAKLRANLDDPDQLDIPGLD